MYKEIHLINPAPDAVAIDLERSCPFSVFKIQRPEGSTAPGRVRVGILNEL